MINTARIYAITYNIILIHKLSDVIAYGSKQRYLLRECFWLIVITEEWTMRKTPKSPGEKIVKDIKRATRKHYSSEEKIRIVLDGLRGEDSRECLAIRVDRKLNSGNVIDALSDLFILRGVPSFIRSDNGPEFVAQAVRG